MRKLAIGFAALIAILSYCGGTPAEATCPPGTRDNWPTCTPIVTTTSTTTTTTTVPETTTTTTTPLVVTPVTVTPTTTVEVGTPPTFPPDSPPLTPPTSVTVCDEPGAICEPATVVTFPTQPNPAGPVDRPPSSITTTTVPPATTLPETGASSLAQATIALLAVCLGIWCLVFARRPDVS